MVELTIGSFSESATLERKNKMCRIIKNILEDFLCQDVNEEPIQKNSNNTSSIFTLQASRV